MSPATQVSQAQRCKHLPFMGVFIQVSDEPQKVCNLFFIMVFFPITGFFHDTQNLWMNLKKKVTGYSLPFPAMEVAHTPPLITAAAFLQRHRLAWISLVTLQSGFASMSRRLHSTGHTPCRPLALQRASSPALLMQGVILGLPTWHGRFPCTSGGWAH